MTAPIDAAELTAGPTDLRPNDFQMKAAEVSLIVGVVLAVAAFGGTEPISFAAVEILFFAVAAWLLLRSGSIAAPVRTRYFVVPALLTALALLQLCPLPAGFLSRFAGRASYTGARFSALSFAPYDSRNGLLILLACFVAFFLAYVVGQDRSRKQRLILALVALGAAEAFYGLAQYLMNVQTIFWYTKKYDLEEATGTYINRNHFAGFLEMVLPFAVCLAMYESEKLLARRKHRTGHAKKLTVKLTSDVKVQAVILWLAVAVVLMAAIVFSRSRMGILAACASLLVVFGLKMLQRRTLPAVLGVAFVALSLCLAGWIGLRPALSRFESVGQEFSGGQSRVSMWPGTLKLIAEHPLVGTGLGTFPVVYTEVQTTFLTQFVNHAHNDYLEITSDLGIPAALLLFASIFFVLLQAVRTFLHGEGKYTPAVSLACVGSIVAILLHSLTDFNLHIPANALLFAVILGLALASTSKMAPAEAAVET
jgi:O-antigen ligase